MKPEPPRPGALPSGALPSSTPASGTLASGTLASGAHPSLERLLQLTLGELSEDEAFAVREHLLGCADCLERARALAALPEPPAPATTLAAEKAADWRRLEAALELPGRPAEAAPARATAPSPFPAPRRTAGWLALAATLLLGAALGLLAGRTRPAAVALAASTHLLPADFAVLGKPPGPDTAHCPPADGFFFWVLGNLDGGATGTIRYAVELEGPLGSRRLETKVNGHGEIEIALPRSATPAGSYRLLVRNLDVRGATAKEFRLTVDCP